MKLHTEHHNLVFTDTKLMGKASETLHRISQFSMYIEEINGKSMWDFTQNITIQNIYCCKYASLDERIE